ncbi:hypothetical protein LCGC14_2994140 [marine sediment metagenome]|uniref:Uncharacterized protein n=1 Tax=marine sediment metagenome TaxID=412755 RepID=A0A0F8ZU24_9ZZZZ
MAKFLVGIQEIHYNWIEVETLGNETEVEKLTEHQIKEITDMAAEKMEEYQGNLYTEFSHVTDPTNWKVEKNEYLNIDVIPNVNTHHYIGGDVFSEG